MSIECGLIIPLHFQTLCLRNKMCNSGKPVFIWIVSASCTGPPLAQTSFSLLRCVFFPIFIYHLCCACYIFQTTSDSAVLYNKRYEAFCTSCAAFIPFESQRCWLNNILKERLEENHLQISFNAVLTCLVSRACFFNFALDLSLTNNESLWPAISIVLTTFLNHLRLS